MTFKETIKIDYDSKDFKKWLQNYKTIREMLKTCLDIKLRITKIYETVNGYHIYIKATIPHELSYAKYEIPTYYLLLNTIELLLLSDNKRAVFNLTRIFYTSWNWNNISVLFKNSEIKKIYVGGKK